MVTSDSESFILKFLSQALRSLWVGLDNVEPHESIDKKAWNSVAPADLGEMAADREMQSAFYKRKRSHDMIDNNSPTRQVNIDGERSSSRLRSSSLAMQLSAIQEGRGKIPQPTHEHQNMYQGNNSYNQSNQIQFPSNNDSQVPLKQEVVPLTGSTQQMFQSETSQSHLYLNRAANGTIDTSYQASMEYQNQNVLQQEQNAARTIIDAINARVQNNTQTQTKSSNIYQSGNNNVMNNGIMSNQNIPNHNFAQPDPSLSGFMVCVPNAPYQGNLHINGAGPVLSGKICRIEGCNAPSASRRPYCTRHSGNRLCEYKHGCTKCAQGATRFCIAHGGGRRCTFPGCDKGARDKFFCAAHGGGKRCSKDGCSKSAVGGSNLCTSHGGGRRCAVDGCQKSAQSSTKFCVKHGGGKKCAEPDCTKVARGRTLYCAGHGGGVRCKLDGCTRIAIGKMQLCRAHGGGSSRANKSKQKGHPTPPLITPQTYIHPSQIQLQHTGAISRQPHPL